MFKSKDGFDSALKHDNFHEISGHKLECRQIKLREELKDIQIETQKQKTLNSGEIKKKKKRRRRKKKKKHPEEVKVVQ
jgi:hypothetical protein